DVAEERLDLKIFRPALRLCHGEAFLPLAHDADRRAFARKQFRRGRADAAAASGHQRKPAIQSSHVSPPYFNSVSGPNGTPYCNGENFTGRTIFDSWCTSAPSSSFLRKNSCQAGSLAISARRRARSLRSAKPQMWITWLSVPISV